MTAGTPAASGTGAPNAGALADELLAQLQQSRAARIGVLGEEPLTWLVVAPLWTDRLARACRFPERPLPLEEFLARAEAAGWCVHRPGERRARTPHLRLQLQAELLPHLSAAERRAALDAALGIEEERERAELLARLVPNLPDELLAEVTEAAWASSGPAFVPVLLALAVRGEPPWRGRLVRELHHRIAAIDDPEERAARLVELRRALPDEVPPATTRTTWEQLVDGEEPPLGRSRREDLLCQLARWVRPEPVEAEIRWRLQRGEPVAAVRLLRAAGDRLDREVTVQLLTALAARLRELDAGADRDRALSDLVTAAVAAGQGSELLPLVWEIIGQIADARLRFDALTELALLDTPAADRSFTFRSAATWAEPAMQPDGTLDLLAEARRIERLAGAGQRERASSFARSLADRLTVDRLQHAAPSPAAVSALQRIARSLEERSRRSREASQLARRLLDAAADLAGRLGDPVARAAALTSTARTDREVMGGLPAHPALADPALVEAARAVHDEEERAWALARLVPVVAARARQEPINEALALAAQLDEAEALTFWMQEGVRGELLEELQRRRGFAWVRAQVVTIAGAVLDAQRGLVVAVPPALARWAELAASVGTAGGTASTMREAARQLDRRVARLLEAGDTGQALTWLDTAKALAPLLRGEFEASVLANTRRVELVHRRWLDRRRLERFLPRAEQVRAFEALLDQPDGPEGAWALHYLGVGGVGKTMLIRHLTAEVAPGRNVVTSRIDFDHLNPDFPRRRPAQLLSELAAELEAEAQDSRLDYLFRRAWESLQEINARAQPATVEDEDLAKALRGFAGFLQALGRRVVLILDTCEELEKFRPAGGRLEQLEATFQLLEALHRQVPALRVVLAGRRPLARTGRGWRLPPGPAGRGDPLLPERKPYLLLHEVRGFDREEAEAFLTRHAGLPPDPALVAAILDRSPDPGSAAEILWDDGHRPPEVPRYNPFDLDLLAGWVRAEPDLTAARLRAGRSDHYVEARIVGRLKHPEVERLLPAVVALGRFDHDLLRPAFDGDDQSFADAERELAASEWIDVQRDQALGTTFLEVDRQLHPRLHGYFQREHRGLLGEARRRLAPALAALVDARPLERLGVDHVSAALRLLPPGDAARLADRLALRVIEHEAWGWAATAGERLLAQDSPLADPDHPAAATLRAMLASALLHHDPDRDLAELWAVVEQQAQNHPDPEVGEWLARRAFLKLLTPESGRERLAPLAASLREPAASPEAERRRLVLMGALLSALHGLLDLAEAGDDAGQLPAPAVFEDAKAATVGTAAVRFAAMLSGRAWLLRGVFQEARTAFEAAVTPLRPLPAVEEPPLAPWPRADWEPPADLPARVLLEAVRSPPAAVAPPAPEPDTAPPDSLAGIDAERLASALLSHRLAHGLAPAEVLGRYERLPRLYDSRRPTCEAHRAVPPLFVNVARGWTALGHAQRALAVLRQAESAAIDQRDQRAADAAALARLGVVRRFRLADEARTSRQRMLQSRDAADRWNAWAVAVLVDPPEELPPPSLDAPPAEWHAWWRVQPAAHVEPSAARLLEMALHDSGGAPEGFTALSLRLDVIEAQWLAGGQPTRSTVVDALGWLTRHPSQVEPAARLALRQHVLRVDGATDLGHWAELLGPRRVAELALDEGELLALRLPERAIHLLDLAGRLFEQAGDPAGAFIALVARLLAAPSERRTAEVRRVYGALSADPGGPPLPDLAALGDPAADPRRHLEHPDWGGWLGRLLVVLAGARGAAEAEAAVARLARIGVRAAELGSPAAPAGAPSDTGGDTGELAPVPPVARYQPPTSRSPEPARSEEAPALSPPAPASVPAGAPQQPQAPPGVPAAASPPPSQPPPAPAPLSVAPDARRRRWPLIVAATAALLAVIGAVLLLLRSRTAGGPPSIGRPPAGGAGSAWLLALGIAVGLIAAALVALLLRGRLAAGVRRLAGLGRSEVVTIVPAPASGDGGRVSLSSAHGALAAREIAAPGFGPYGEQVLGSPGSLPARLALRVAAEVAHLPWEALVLPAMRSSLVARRRSCWRALDIERRAEPRAERQPWWRVRHRPCLALAPPSWAPLLQGNLGGVQLVDPSRVDLAKWRPEPLVILGTPVETSAGTRLQVWQADGSTLLVEPDLPRWYGHDLVVVAGEPTAASDPAAGPGGGGRVDAEREATADLRRCAADLMAAGAGAVLCLPSMPVDVAAKVLKALDRRLRRVERRGWRALVAATAALRPVIEGSVPASSPLWEATRELAVEVTVFVRTPPAAKA